MYIPTNSKQLLTDCTKLLLYLETQNINIDHGINEILLFDNLLTQYPNIGIKEPIVGPKFKDFIYSMYEQYDQIINYKDVLPFMPYNIRSGIYSSILGLMAEYISLWVVNDLYKNGEILQDFNSQLAGHDIRYLHNDNNITADVKLSTTDWTNEKSIHVHKDWFHEKKKSTRFHIVDIHNHSHFIIGRSFLHYNHEKYGDYIPIKQMKSYSIYSRQDISHLIELFYNKGTI
jgi:hypothetical protein